MELDKKKNATVFEVDNNFGQSKKSFHQNNRKKKEKKTPKFSQKKSKTGEFGNQFKKIPHQKI